MGFRGIRTHVDLSRSGFKTDRLPTTGPANWSGALRVAANLCGIARKLASVSLTVNDSPVSLRDMTCTAEIVLRTTSRTTLQNQQGLAHRKHVCSRDATHEIGPMVVQVPQP